jgi:glutathione S-transferase
MTLLYEYPPTRSQRAKWALEELGIDYRSEIVDLSKGEQNAEAYRSVHPLGVVPAIETGGYRMFESIAIVLQLVDEHPEKSLAPEPGSPERASYYQWCVFAAAELDPALMMFFDNSMRPLEAMRPPGTRHDPTLAERGREGVATHTGILSKALDDRDYLLGSSFSGADIVVGHSCFMAAHMGLLGDGRHPVLERYHQRLQQRPAYKRIYPRPD